VRRAGLSFAAVAAGPLLGKAPWTMAANSWQLWRGYRQALSLLRKWRPTRCLVTGGFASVPVALAARRLDVPLLVYLPDLRPGLAIRFMRRWAEKVAVSLPEAAAYFGAKAVVTGYPVRSDFGRWRQAEALKTLGLSTEKPVLLVFGGSRGARSINRALVSILPDVLSLAQVLHVSGSLDSGWVADEALKLPVPLRRDYHHFAYLYDEMPAALHAADLAVSRAGASVLGELPMAELPAVLVPYPYAGQHQRLNAEYLRQAGGAVIVPDAQLERDLWPTLRTLLEDSQRRQQMQAALHKMARPDAAERLANLVMELGG